MKKEKMLRLTLTAIFTAIVLVVQMVGSSIKVGPVSFSLVLIPIVVGGMLIGPYGGAFLGFVFGLVTVIGGLTGADPFTAYLLQAGTSSAIFTVLLCLVKATAAGLISALIFKALSNENKYLGVILASATAPIVNTGIFVLGTLTVLAAPLSANTAFVNDTSSLVYFVIIGCAGVNFIVELLVNIVLSPSVYSFVNAISKLSPARSQTKAVSSAIPITTGTNTLLTLSAKRAIGAFVLPASSTSRII